MKRFITILAVTAILAGCAIWQKLPADATAEERAAHQAKIESEEAKLRAGADIAAVAAGPFGWIAPLVLQGVLGAAAMLRK